MSMTPAQYEDWKGRMDAAVADYATASSAKLDLYQTEDAATAAAFAASAAATEADLVAAAAVIEGLNQEYTLFLGAKDIVSPTVVSVTPADSATGVSRSPSVDVVFSEAMDPDTMIFDNIYLGRIGGPPNPSGGSVALSTDHKTATLTFASPLSATAVFKVHVSPAVADAHGNYLDVEYVQENGFTTGT